MKHIGRIIEGLEHRGEDFVVEALAKELPPEWISDVLAQTGRESVRQRLLPARLTVWLVILMGLFRRTSWRNSTTRGGRANAGRPRSLRAPPPSRRPATASAPNP